MPVARRPSVRGASSTGSFGSTNLPFENWVEPLGSERLTGATLDRLTHRCQILECNGESYRLADAERRQCNGESYWLADAKRRRRPPPG